MSDGGNNCMCLEWA